MSLKTFTLPSISCDRSATSGGTRRARSFLRALAAVNRARSAPDRQDVALLRWLRVFLVRRADFHSAPRDLCQKWPHPEKTFFLYRPCSPPSLPFDAKFISSG